MSVEATLFLKSGAGSVARIMVVKAVIPLVIETAVVMAAKTLFLTVADS